MVWINRYNDKHESIFLFLIFIESKLTTTDKTIQLVIPEITITKEEQAKRPSSTPTDPHSEVYLPLHIFVLFIVIYLFD